MSGELVLLGGFFLFVLALASAAIYWFSTRAETASEAAQIPSEINLDVTMGPGARGFIVSLLSTLGELLPSSESSRGDLNQRLRHAGYRKPASITSYFGAKYATAILLGLILGGVAMLTGAFPLGGLIAGFGLGFLAPDRILDFLVKARNNRLRRALPPALDLLVMSLEAGQSLDQAMLAASRGLQRLAPDLSSELALVYLETRASKSRAEAILHMAQRNGEPEIRKFATLLLDSDRFGASLAPTLRQHAKFMRVRFRQRAQESARKLSVKMVFPVFFLIFPSILVVTLGPSVITIMRSFDQFWQ